MRKLLLLLFLLGIIVSLQFCSSSKKLTSAKQPAKITYAANIQPLIINYCSPCHIPPRGFKKPLDTYDAAKTSVDEMIARMQKSPDERGFMPFKHAKLSDSTIMVFVNWKNSGLLEK